MIWIFIALSIIGLSAIFLIGFVLRGNPAKTSFIHADGKVFLEQDELHIIKLTNLYRIAQDKRTLKVDLELCMSAEKRVKSMISEGKISKKGASKTAIDLLDLGLKLTTENVGCGYNAPADIVDAWFRSAEHRSNIKGNWTYTGVSILTDSKTGKKYYCQIFGR